MVYTYSEILLLNLEKERHSAICDLDEAWGHYAKWNKPVTEKDKHCMTPLYEVSERVKCIASKSTMVTANGQEAGNGELLINGHKVSDKHNE